MGTSRFRVTSRAGLPTYNAISHQAASMPRVRNQLFSLRRARRRPNFVGNAYFLWRKLQSGDLPGVSRAFAFKNQTRRSPGSPGTLVPEALTRATLVEPSCYNRRSRRDIQAAWEPVRNYLPSFYSLIHRLLPELEALTPHRLGGPSLVAYLLP